MADTITVNYQFVKPEIDGSTDTWGEKINANLDSVDNLLKQLFDNKFDKVGGTLTGNLVVSKTAPAVWLENLVDGKLSKLVRVGNDALVILGADGTSSVAFRDDGSIWSKQWNRTVNEQIEKRAQEYADDRAANKVIRTGDTMTGALVVNGSLRSRDQASLGNAHIWLENANGTERAVIFAAADNVMNLRAGGGPSTQLKPDGQFVFNVNGIGQFIITDIRHWALRGEDARINSLRGLRRVDAGTTSFTGNNQTRNGPERSFVIGMSRGGQGDIQGFQSHYIQAYSDARGWFNID